MNLKFKFDRLCKTYKFRPSRKKSQHFLVNENVLKREVDYANISSKDVVLEIGAGLGFLTELLLQKAKEVIAIEIDKNLVKILRQELKHYKNLNLIEGDFLKIDLAQYKINKIVANIPYHISSQILFKITQIKFDIGILTFQEEFARRLVAKPCTSEYGRLTISANLFFDIDIAECVPAYMFVPKPKIDSVIVKIKPNPKIDRACLNTKIVHDFIIWLFNNKNQKAIKNVKRFLKRTVLPEDIHKDILSLSFLEKRSICLSLNEICEIISILCKFSS